MPFGRDSFDESEQAANYYDGENEQFVYRLQKKDSAREHFGLRRYR